MNIEQAIQKVMPSLVVNDRIDSDPHDWSDLQKAGFISIVRREMMTEGMYELDEMDNECFHRSESSKPEAILKQEIDYIFTTENYENIYSAMLIGRNIETEDQERIRCGS